LIQSTTLPERVLSHSPSLFTVKQISWCVR